MILSATDFLANRRKFQIFEERPYVERSIFFVKIHGAENAHFALLYEPFWL
jgi:hypothetical protein